MQTVMTATLTVPIRLESNFIDEIEYRIMNGQTYVEITMPRQTVEIPVDVRKCNDAPTAFYRMISENAATELMHVIKSEIANQIKAHLAARGAEQGTKND